MDKKILIIITFLLIVGFGFITFRPSILTNPPVNRPTIKNISPTIQPVRAITYPGKLFLTKDNVNSGGNLTLIAVFDSDNQPVTGFDIDIRYNHNKLKYKGYDGLITGYDINENDEQREAQMSELIISGVKSLYNNDEIIFKNTKVAKLSFAELEKIDDNDIQLYYVTGATYDCNLINGDTQDILGNVGQIQL